MEYLLHESVHHDSLIDVYFDNSALLAVEKAEMTQHLADRERVRALQCSPCSVPFAMRCFTYPGVPTPQELRNMALMLHAEDETRYAMLKNPKAFKRVKPSKKKGKKGKRGRSPAKKKKGGAAGGKSKSKGKSKGKSPSKREYCCCATAPCQCTTLNGWRPRIAGSTSKKKKKKK